MDSTSKQTSRHSIEIGHRAVWVNADTGECIGRFGLMGVDVHRRIKDQGEEGECFDCIHSRVNASDWERFKSSMLKFHGIDLSHVQRPDFAS